jgi:hypothetical protein
VGDVTSLPDLFSILASPWVTLITIAFGIVGVVGTVYTILAWRRKEKLPYYDIRSDSIIRDLTSRFERLRVVYDGESIRDFTATHIVFWNGGRDPIRHDDVPPSNPIAVRLKEGGASLMRPSWRTTTQIANFAFV